MTVIDSHCHAWSRWPYQPPVPDDESRGQIEQLLHEMDRLGVDQAVVICAQIERNPENNEYIAEQVRRYPNRLHQFPDVDCSWSPTYHQPGAAARLAAIADRWPIKGFTHYLRGDDDGAWLYSDEGLAFFRVAAERHLIASIAGRPRHQAALRRVAAAFPTLPILCHHLAGLRAAEPPEAGLREVLASARLPNICIKVSGFAYCSQVAWEYPYADTGWIVRTLYEHFGPHQLCWGSDYPVVRFYMTYQQALEAFRTHCTFVPEADKALILGGTLARLLGASDE
ncbi:MAG: amidohydrolase family protein [Thermomicrobiales bacterium]